MRRPAYAPPPLLVSTRAGAPSLTPQQFLQEFADALRPARLPLLPSGRSSAECVSCPLLSSAEVALAIQQTAANKAPGPDGHRAAIYHTFLAEYLPFLRNLFQRCLDTGVFPSEWQAGDSFLLPKGGRESKLTCSIKDFRIITLLPAAGKIFERLILHRLQHWDRISCKEYCH